MFDGNVSYEIVLSTLGVGVIAVRTLKARVMNVLGCLLKSLAVLKLRGLAHFRQV